MPGTAKAPGKEKVTEGGMGAGAGLAGTRGSAGGGERVFAARSCGWATARAWLIPGSCWHSSPGRGCIERVLTWEMLLQTVQMTKRQVFFREKRAPLGSSGKGKPGELMGFGGEKMLLQRELQKSDVCSSLLPTSGVSVLQGCASPCKTQH